MLLTYRDGDKAAMGFDIAGNLNAVGGDVQRMVNDGSLATITNGLQDSSSALMFLNGSAGEQASALDFIDAGGRIGFSRELIKAVTNFVGKVELINDIVAEIEKNLPSLPNINGHTPTIDLVQPLSAFKGFDDTGYSTEYGLQLIGPSVNGLTGHQ